MPELQGMPTLRSPSQTMSMTFAEYWTVEWNFLSSNLTHFLSVMGCCQFCCKEDYILTDEGLHAVSCLSPPQSHSMGTNPFDPQLVGRHQQSRTWNNMEDFLVSPTWGDFGEKFQSCHRMGNWEHSMITGSMETLGTLWKWMKIISCIIYWLYIHIYIYIIFIYTHISKLLYHFNKLRRLYKLSDGTKTFVDVAQTPESVSLAEVLHPSDHLSIAADLCFRINRAKERLGLGLDVSLTMRL